MGKRITERLQSVVEVFMDACHVWMNYSHDERLFPEVEKAQRYLNHLDVDHCNEEDLQSIQDMTLRMLEEMNESLNASGFGGLRYKGVKH
ncbi:hypothetical protein JXL19_06120 [bacterium]|nr:hypothetical protein [bacterium]